MNHQLDRSKYIKLNNLLNLYLFGFKKWISLSILNLIACLTVVDLNYRHVIGLDFFIKKKEEILSIKYLLIITQEPSFNFNNSNNYTGGFYGDRWMAQEWGTSAMLTRAWFHHEWHRLLHESMGKIHVRILAQIIN